MVGAEYAYEPDRSWRGKIRRRAVRAVGRTAVGRTVDRPIVTFSFDDAPLTAATSGAAALERRGVTGTFYLSAGLGGTSGPMGPILDGDTARRLSEAGHELACHTYTHLDCGQARGEQALDDVRQNAEAFESWGLPRPTNFAYPYGDVSARCKTVLAPSFDTMRGLHHGIVSRRSDRHQLPAVGLEGADALTVGRMWIDRLVDRGGWLILYTHDVDRNPSPWGCDPDVFEELIDHTIARGAEIMTVRSVVDLLQIG